MKTNYQITFGMLEITGFIIMNLAGSIPCEGIMAFGFGILIWHTGGGVRRKFSKTRFFLGFIVTRQKVGFTFLLIKTALKPMTNNPEDGGGESGNFLN